MRSVGTRACATSSLWRVSRANLWCPATRASAAVADAVNGPEPRTSISRPWSVAVTWMSSGFFRGASISAIAQAACNAPSRLPASTGQRSIATRVWARAVEKPTVEHRAGAAGMEHHAAAAVSVRIDQIADRRVDAGLAQCRDNKIAFPGAIRRALPMLQGAAAADAEMRADRRDAFGARRVDGEKRAPVRMAGYGVDLGGFARQACRERRSGRRHRRRRHRRAGRPGR